MDVGAVKVSGQSEGRVVSNFDSFFFSLELDDRCQRTKGFVFAQLHIAGHARNQHWRHKVAVIALGHSARYVLGALAQGVLKVLLDLLNCRAID